MKLFALFKKFKSPFKNFKVGDKVKVISCTRDFDNADAYAGYEGILEEIFADEEGCLIKGETSILIIPFTCVRKLKLKKI